MPGTFSHFVFVDFENVPKVDLGVVEGKPVHVTLLIGKNQTKIDSDLFLQSQEFRDQVTARRVKVSGRNALDMLLACYLGEAVEREPRAQFTVISKDKDFEPVIGHLLDRGVNVARKDTFASAFGTALKKPAAPKAAPVKKPARDRFAELVEKMKTAPNHRPKKRDALLHHITAFYGKELPATGAEGVAAQLESRGVIAIDAKGKVSYH